MVLRKLQNFRPLPKKNVFEKTAELEPVYVGNPCWRENIQICQIILSRSCGKNVVNKRALGTHETDLPQFLYMQTFTKKIILFRSYG